MSTTAWVLGSAVIIRPMASAHPREHAGVSAGDQLRGGTGMGEPRSTPNTMKDKQVAAADQATVRLKAGVDGSE